MTPATSETSVSTRLTAMDDAHVTGGTSANTNFGTLAEMLVRKDTSADNLRFTYIRFPLGTIAGASITSATLRLNAVSSIANEPVSIRIDSAGNTWSESTITYNNRPAINSAGAALANVSVGGAARWYDIDLSTFIRDAAARREASITVGLSGSSNSWSLARIGSSESSNAKPELLINGSAPSQPTPQPLPLSWNQVASIGQAREESVTFDIGGKMYVIGGYDSAITWSATTRSDRYDPNTNTWTRIGNAPTKITHAGVAVDEANGVAYMAGGYIGDFPDPMGTNVVWKYHAASDTWTQIKPLPIARGAGGAALIGQTLYFFGGGSADRTSDHTNTWSLNLADASANWVARADMLHARNHFGHAVVNGRIYVIGGQIGLEAASVNMAHVERYNPSANRWEAVTSLPRVLSHFTGSTDVYKGRYIFLAGGEHPHNTAMADVLMYDAQLDRWSTMTSLPAARRAASGMIIGDRFYVGGGFIRSQGFSSTFWSTDLTVLQLI